jgi:RNA-splicing ligase RtcB
MITYKGKYNFANVMIDEVDEETAKQIMQFLNHPAFAHTYIAIMPDCHKGNGAVIGFTAKLNDYIIVNVVGVDLGCGIVAYKLDKIKEINYKALDEFIREHVPSGFNHHRDPKLSEYDDNVIEFMNISKNIGLKSLDVLCQLGTLGSGNHFHEIDKDPNNNYWLVIHSGSRNFGLKIAQFYQNKAKELMNKMFIGDAYKTLEFLPRESKDAQDYLHDAKFAQIFAKMNRQMMADVIIRKFFKLDIEKLEKVESIHNYINFEDNRIRKGAISAHAGERVIIPLNMRDGTIIGTGKGSELFNLSAPHGAGRILSRSKAKESLSLEQFQEVMKGIYSTCITKDTLDESPMAYKKAETIVEALKETVDVDFIMKPVYNFKAIEK